MLYDTNSKSEMMTEYHKEKLLAPRQGDLAEYLGQYFLFFRDL